MAYARLPGLTPGDLRAAHFVHDGDHFVAVVGEVLHPQFSNLPAVAILARRPLRIWTPDRLPTFGGAIMAGLVQGSVPFLDVANHDDRT